MSFAAEGISKALDGHGIAHVAKDECIALTESDVRFYIEVRDRMIADKPDVMIQLNIGTAAPMLDGRTIWESFAGVGEDRRAAEANALGKFLSCQFHVILSALAGHRCEDDVAQWEIWKGARGAWRMCNSPLLLIGIDPAKISFDGFYEHLKREFQARATPGLHWGSVFFAFLNGTLTGNDVQLDGAPWAGAASAIGELAFDLPAGYFSGRYFFLALADGEAEQREI
jgi:hypothetical protein